MDRLRTLFGTSLVPAVILAAIAVIVAALSGAILLYDGAWFLFQLMDTHRIDIPQLRISFALMQWPAIWTAESTDSLPAVRFVFSLVVMAMPPLSIAACWWIVRKEAPWLIVWPALGVLIVDLPGQMHWIATSIRTNQLFWPILLAIFIGMPDRVVPLVAILLISALFMHPQISVYLLAGVCAALFIAWQRPEYRQRLTGAATVFMFAAIYRYGILSGGYEAEEAAISNQIGQWQRSVLWMPLVALVSVLVIAIILVLRQYGAFPKLRGSRGKATLAAVATPGIIAIIIWAADPSLWKTAIDYRGPSMWHSLILMGIAFLDVVIQHRRRRTTEETKMRIRLSNFAAALFCVVIALQSSGWNGELNKIRDAMASNDGGCIVAESLPGYEDSPLNFWSLPAASIGIQSRNPDYVVLPGHLCDTAIASGVIPMDLTNPTRDTPGRFMNMFHLRGRVADVGTCWQAYEAGWHDLEVQNNETRRWSTGTGAIILVMDQPGKVNLRGVLDSVQRPNEVKIKVNGMVQRSLPVEGDQYQALDGIELTLAKGPNVIEFQSMRPATKVGDDPRDLSIAVVNLEFVSSESGDLCGWRQEPAKRPDGMTPSPPASERPKSTPVPATPYSATPRD